MITQAHPVSAAVAEKFFPSGTGILVEVGAAGPFDLSFSHSFRERGWRVIGIEPNPVFCAMHRKEGFEIFEFACGDHDEEGVDFRVVDSTNVKEAQVFGVTYESFSGLGVDTDYERMRSTVAGTSVAMIKVGMRKLDTIVGHILGLKSFDLLSIDVEGFELGVLHGFSIDKYRPKVVVVENLFGRVAYREFMTQHGYELWQHCIYDDIYYDGAQ